MWMKATEGADGTVFYIDRDSIKKEGSLIRVWELQDLKAKGPLEEKVEASFGRVRFEEREKESTLLQFSWGIHGAGVTLKSDQTLENGLWLLPTRLLLWCSRSLVL